MHAPKLVDVENHMGDPFRSQPPNERRNGRCLVNRAGEMLSIKRMRRGRVAREVIGSSLTDEQQPRVRWQSLTHEPRSRPMVEDPSEVGVAFLAPQRYIHRGEDSRVLIDELPRPPHSGRQQQDQREPLSSLAELYTEPSQDC